MTALVVLLVFLAVTLLMVGGYLLLRDVQGDGQQVKQRLRQLTDDARNDREESGRKTLSLEREQTLTALDKSLLEIPQLRDLDRFLIQAGISFGPAAAMGISLLAAFAGVLVAVLLFRSSNPLVMLLGLGLGAWVPWLLWRGRRKKRNQELVHQLPDAMDFFARSLRAGNPFVSSLKTAADEIQDPLARELSLTFDEINFGLEVDEAMQNLAQRIEAEEVRLFVTSVLVQRSTGGNLAELMNRLSALLRERLRTRGEIRVQAADMRNSAHVLIALPIFVAVLLQLVNPDYMSGLFESETGRTILMVQIGLMATGYLIMRRMINFRI